MPKLGQSEEEATIVRWLKKEGETVARGEALFEIETDKALLEVESFFDGTLLKVLVPEGVTVPVQATVGFVGDPGEPLPEVPAVTAVPRGTGVSPVVGHGQDARATGEEESKPPLVPLLDKEGIKGRSPLETARPGLLRISPRAARLAEESVINPAPIAGTGPGGRILEHDVKGYLEVKGYDRLRITPAARKLAAREHLDVLSLEPRGGSGRITLADVRAAMAERPKAMTRMRQVIAQRLTRSFTSMPHFFVTVSVDMTDLETLRSELKGLGRAYTVTDFILKAVALALQEFPDVNSSTDGEKVWWHSRVHLGLAVALEQGLLVPVIRDADELTLAEIHERATELTAKARAGKLTPAEMAGSTFTVSNLGMLDVENFTAIINPGESAILAVSSIRKQPVVKDDQLVPRSIMKMTLTSDHRIVDGASAARFLNAIRSKLEEITLWRRLA
jgi:pyruvate dehydrogenase E2 component (dihydrolipoamide acetyltransferase)